MIQALSPNQLRCQSADFWLEITDLASRLGLDISSLHADHLALRVNDRAVAQAIHQHWLNEGQQISEAMINGRPIVVIKLNTPIELGAHKVDCLELPYPSDKVYPQQGWEHVEFVLPCDARTTDELMQALFEFAPGLKQNWHQLGTQGIKVKTSSPQGEHERLANPTIAFKYQGVCIKVHPHTLEAVIASEHMS
ncbi:MAG: VOC family protein [Vibrio sp.]